MKMEMGILAGRSLKSNPGIMVVWIKREWQLRWREMDRFD